ncbi:hypothetical protein KFE25_005073, partial [Diacronema lutheri]
MSDQKALRIDAPLFWRRAAKLYDAWKAGRGVAGSPWHGLDALVIDTGKYDEEALYLRSTSMHNWLFGLELPETVLLFTETMMYALAGSKKVGLLEAAMAERPDDAPFSILCYMRSKADGDAANYATLRDKLAGSYAGQAVALLLKEAPVGDAAAAWRSALAAAALSQRDLAPAVSELLLVKDEAETAHVRVAGLVSAALVEQHLLSAIKTIIDEEKPA